MYEECYVPTILLYNLYCKTSFLHIFFMTLQIKYFSLGLFEVFKKY